jgi:hypothetical protein
VHVIHQAVLKNPKVTHPATVGPAALCEFRRDADFVALNGRIDDGFLKRPAVLFQPLKEGPQAIRASFEVDDVDTFDKVVQVHRHPLVDVFVRRYGILVPLGRCGRTTFCCHAKLILQGNAVGR